MREEQLGHLPGLYYRFNIEHGLENVSLADWKMLSEVKAHTKAYLQEPLVERKLNQLVDVLRNRSANITATQLYQRVPEALSQSAASIPPIACTKVVHRTGDRRP